MHKGLTATMDFGFSQRPLMPSLDAASEQVWQKVNAPAVGIDLQQVIAGIARARRQCRGQMWLEVMLVAGVNDGDQHLAALRQAVEQIDPERVQINTVVRSPAQAHAHPLTPDRLRHALEVLGPKAEIIAPLPDDHAARIPHQQTAEAVFELLRRRPCTTADLAVGLGIHPNEAIKHVQSLLADKRIRALEGQGPTYYAAR